MTVNSPTTENAQVLESLWQASPDGAPIPNVGNTAFSQSIDLHPALEEVRKMQEFQPPPPSQMDELLKHPWIQDLTKQINEWLGQELGKFSQWLAGLPVKSFNHLPDSIRDLFGGIVVFIVILLSLYAFYILLGLLLRLREAKAPKSILPLGQIDEEPIMDSAYHYQKAQASAKEGQYQAALFQLYLGSLCLLDERAIVPYEASRSNLEYLDILAESAKMEAKQRQPVHHSFQRLSQKFEASRYGKAPVSPEEFATSQAEYQKLQEFAVAHA